ncbi:hypothetical protein EC973_002669 [Apophysomyces ossiformis]|uniref:Selenoprotein O n=1 Tax=Apophysomyces ossiformis TaxID=679940 RepID=A0A8H7ELK1_9FUNG|nr:hypothetical protein EC973_002669 [Apophysomyces ossiformis]
MSVQAGRMRSLASLPLRPAVFTRSLPGDSSTNSHTDSGHLDRLLRVSRPVYNSVFAYVHPEKVPEPKLLAISRQALKDIELDPAVIEDDPNEFLQVFSGNICLPDTRPWAHCYGGHQFGAYADQLGDGRVISLFETQNSRGERWEIQLKGAGRTAFSRFGDGYAVLRSSIREFLASEYMYALGIPTTRALSLIGTSRQVFRDDAPSGVNQPERGAVVARMANSWLRFGSFQIFYFRGDMENVRRLADYAIKEVVHDEDDLKAGNRFARFYWHVAKRTARMVAEWQALGFCHGVMNTDNMSISGLTLDYGPYQFLDFYEPDHISNHSDYAGQYSFKRQPTVCIYNLYKFAEPLFELIGARDKVDSVVFSSPKDDEVTSKDVRGMYKAAGKAFVTEILSERFSDCFMEHLTAKMQKKLGLVKDKKDEDMRDLIIPLLDWMTEYKVNHNKFFRSLANYRIGNAAEEDENQALDELLDIRLRDGSMVQECKQALKPWLAMYRHRLIDDGLIDNLARKKRMNSVNPRFTLHNWILQEVIDAFDKNDDETAMDILNSCLEACMDPFKEKYDDERVERWIKSPVPEVRIHIDEFVP